MSAYLRPRSGDPAELGAPPTLDVTVDGEPVSAHAGQTVAAVLLANGRDTWRTTRVHDRPRGIFCGIGACHDCLVTVNGLPDVRACQRTITPGDQITTQPGAVLPTTQPGATHPTPRPTTALPTSEPATGDSRTEPGVGVSSGRSTTTGVGPRVEEVVVVGAGPAGIAAALAAADAGAQVLLVDNGRALGGQYNRQLAPEFAANRPDRLQHEWKAFATQRDRLATHPRITYLPDTSIWAIENLRLWAQTGPADSAGRRPFPIDAKAIVLATGAYDRVLPFPGWDLPGVYTAGAAQALAKGQRIAVGHRVLVAGTGPFLLPVAESLIGVGARVVALLEANALRTVRKGWSTDPLVAPSKLREAVGYGALLARHRIPLRHGWTVIAAHGSSQVEAATIARLDDSWSPIPGSERRVEVDAICVGFGFTANLELAVSARCNLTTGPDGGPAVAVDTDQQTSTPGIFAAGELTGIGGATLSTAEGTLAGTAAAHHTQTTAPAHHTGTTAPAHESGTTASAHDARTATSAHDARTAASANDTGTTASAHHAGATASARDTGTAASAHDTGTAASAHDTRATPEGTPADSAGGHDIRTAATRPPRATAPPAAETNVKVGADPAVVAAVVKGRRFAAALARAYPVRDGWKSWSTADTLVCRCEEVTRGELESAAEQRGLGDGRAMKLSSRAGLGMCQGRVCSRTVAALLARPGDVPETSMKRPIAVPVRLRDLAAAEAAEAPLTRRPTGAPGIDPGIAPETMEEQ
ncbi:MAG TPA: FAD-dependent oxidoreductase [Kribbella sp.]